MNKHIITIEQLKKCGRPIGKMVDSTKLEAFITEVEQLYIKPAMGESLFLRIQEEIAKENIEDSKLKILLDGGIYKEKDFGKSNDNIHSIMGLRITISYYVYAQYVMCSDIESTRYGLSIKNDEYSNHISDKSRSSLYNSSIEIAKGYLKECISFCKISGLSKEEGKSKINIGGCTIRKIG